MSGDLLDRFTARALGEPTGLRPALPRPRWSAPGPDEAGPDSAVDRTARQVHWTAPAGAEGGGVEPVGRADPPPTAAAASGPEVWTPVGPAPIVVAGPAMSPPAVPASGAATDTPARTGPTTRSEPSPAGRTEPRPVDSRSVPVVDPSAGLRAAPGSIPSRSAADSRTVAEQAMPVTAPTDAGPSTAPPASAAPGRVAAGGPLTVQQSPTLRAEATMSTGTQVPTGTTVPTGTPAADPPIGRAWTAPGPWTGQRTPTAPDPTGQRTPTGSHLASPADWFTDGPGGQDPAPRVTVTIGRLEVLTGNPRASAPPSRPVPPPAPTPVSDRPRQLPLTLDGYRARRRAGRS